jgi:hypothetical protein
VLRKLAADASERGAEAIRASVETELRTVDLWDSEHQQLISQRLKRISQTAAGLYDQGGTFDQKVALRIDPLQVIVAANQLLQTTHETTLRLFRSRDSARLGWDKQTLGALIRTHQNSTGERFRAEFVLLNEDGRVAPATKVLNQTVQHYEAMAAKIAAGSIPAKPSARACASCPYFMLCDQGRS